jgi:uncharacterized protein involved in cysteine biosynthesis
MQTLPCPLCGYHAPGLDCPHCALSSSEPTLAAPRGSLVSRAGDGPRAVAVGLRILASTPRIKRLLVPPVLLTGAVFAVVAVWAWNAVSRLLEAARSQSLDELSLAPGWRRDAVEWLLQRWFVIALAKASGLIALSVVLAFVALWTFSIAYEAISGPFLDEVHGRIETRWFGRDPFKSVGRPNDISDRRIALWMSVAIVPSLAAILAWWYGTPPASRAWLAVPPLAFAAVSLAVRDFGEWFSWALGAQMRTLWVSLKSSALAAAILVLFFWVKFLPFVGYPAFAMITGFATALTLLDIPFSRRRWDLGQRLSFLFANLGAVVGFGLTTSLLFLVPIFGPLIGVPAASIGGLWLLCRRDKNALRPAALRVTKPRSARAATAIAPR